VEVFNLVEDSMFYSNGDRGVVRGTTSWGDLHVQFDESPTVNPTCERTWYVYPSALRLASQ